MPRISWPLYSLTAQGWFGRSFYKVHGTNSWGYPVGLINRYLVSSANYSRMGWCYQRRRTWHGIIYVFQQPPISAQKRTSKQQAILLLCREAVAAWKALTGLEKGIWNSYRYPVKCSGYNRFVGHYIKNNYIMPLYWGNLDKAVGDATKIDAAISATVYFSRAGTILAPATGGDSIEAEDHGSAATDEVVNVCYGTGEAPPEAATTTEGALYLQYTA